MSPKTPRSDWSPKALSSPKVATTTLKKPILTLQVGSLTDEAYEADIVESTLLGAGLHIQEELGRGNQSSVHLAKHLRKGTYRCVKRFDKKTITASAYDFMKAEYGTLQRVGGHPHVAEAFSMFQDAEFFYIELAYYKGGDFTMAKHNAHVAGVSLDADWWSGVFTQCFEALAHLHGHGVTHCDVKEPNLMFKTDKFDEPSVVLIDFGVAQSAQDERIVIYGTPGYIAPEVWATKNWQPESDMFSLGVVILQILADRVPDEKDPRRGIFVEGTASLREIKVATQTREPPFAAMPRCHGQLELLARVLLAKDPAQRPTAAQALSGDWMYHLETVNPSQANSEPTTPKWAAAPPADTVHRRRTCYADTVHPAFRLEDNKEKSGQNSPGCQVHVAVSVETTITSAVESIGTLSLDDEHEHSLEQPLCGQSGKQLAALIV
jgi:serine/threonine protein kinase